MSCSCDIAEEMKIINEAIAEQNNTKRKILRDLDFIVLDNSIRETTVGQLRGHTLENKIKIYEEVKKCGFKYKMVAAFNHMTKVGDTFCQWLVDNGEDRSDMFAFSEISDKIKDGIYDDSMIPVGMRKCKKYGIPNVFFDMDMVDPKIDWGGRYTNDDVCKLIEKRLTWCFENISQSSKVLFGFRDFAFAMKTREGAERVLTVTKFLSKLERRCFGICMEEPGKHLPEEVGAWCAALRRVMDKCGWRDAKFFVHLHKRWGFAQMNQLESLMNGADGVWAGLCEEGAGMGHASSTVTIMNLIRMGNKKVLQKYNCQYLRKAAREVTKITTGKKPHYRELIYGERALDLWIPGEENSAREFDLAAFFGQKTPNRITDLSSLDMIRERLENLFGKDPQFTNEMAEKMKKLLLRDMSTGRKEEYMSRVGIALLFDRAGGKMTVAMRDVIDKVEVEDVRSKALIRKVREMWDEWDIEEDDKLEGHLSFDSFYNGFMAPYFGCFRCEDTRKGLRALDMDKNGFVEWSEFSLYLKWAVREYPHVHDVDKLLSCTFRKGIIPAMHDENVKAAREDEARALNRACSRVNSRPYVAMPATLNFPPILY